MKYDGLKISKESVDKIPPKIEPISFDIMNEGYESPIKVMIERINGQIKYEAENAVYEEVRRIGVDVDKNELIKALRYDRGQYEEGYRRGYSASSNAEKWISVEDRLPEIGVEVIVCDNYGDVSTDFIDKDSKCWNEPRKYIIDIYYTHWMPLPEPPKER